MSPHLTSHGPTRRPHVHALACCSSCPASLRKDKLDPWARLVRERSSPSSLPAHEPVEKIPARTPKRNTKTGEDDSEVIDALAQLDNTLALPKDASPPSGSKRLPLPRLPSENASAPTDGLQDSPPILAEDDARRSLRARHYPNCSAKTNSSSGRTSTGKLSTAVHISLK